MLYRTIIKNTLSKDWLFLTHRLCCAYGITGNDDRGFDCLIVPGAKSISGAAIPAARFCGGSKGLVSKGSMTADTIKAFTGARINRTICCKTPNLTSVFTIDIRLTRSSYT